MAPKYLRSSTASLTWQRLSSSRILTSARPDRRHRHRRQRRRQRPRRQGGRLLSFVVDDDDGSDGDDKVGACKILEDESRCQIKEAVEDLNYSGPPQGGTRFPPYRNGGCSCWQRRWMPIATVCISFRYCCSCHHLACMLGAGPAGACTCPWLRHTEH